MTTTAIFNKFKNDHIQVDARWLNDCLEYFKKHQPNITPDSLYGKAYDQWRASDLSDSGVSFLRESLTSEIEGTINGKYSAQIQCITNTSE